MAENRNVAGLVALLLIVVGLILFLRQMPGADEDEEMKPKPRPRGDRIAGVRTKVGTGWSLDPDPARAVREAMGMAKADGAGADVDFLILFTSSGTDIKPIVVEARKAVGESARVYGGSSDSRAVMTDDGFIRVSDKAYEVTPEKKGLALMAISSPDMQFGVGFAEFAEGTPNADQAKAAVEQAIADAGQAPDNPPRIAMVLTSRGAEAEVVQGIEHVVGAGTPLLGGTAGGPEFAVTAGGQFGFVGEDPCTASGVAVAVLYTDLPMGFVFEGGFDVKAGRSGIVTKANGSTIVEIDSRPALDVYDEWLQGGISRFKEEGLEPAEIRRRLSLFPFYRRYTAPAGQEHFLFSHAWPPYETPDDKTVFTSTQIKEGERVHAATGSWDTLLNRVANLPAKTMTRGTLSEGATPVLAIGYLCAGVMGIIPPAERDKMPLLLNKSSGGVPFVANFTWGEIGHFPGLRNMHGNLLTSLLVIGEPPPDQGN